MTDDAYSRAGVSQEGADAGVEAIVSVLRGIDPGRPSRDVLGSGHYASVLRIDGRRGLALCTDGVGTKLLVAEALGRWDTVGIDCIAMNVNDLVCVGAEPIAMVDYVAVPRIDPRQLGALAEGLRAGAEDAGIEIPGGELAQVGEIVAGLDLVGAAVGLVDLDRVVDGARIEPGDVVVGIPSSGLHSNGFSLARMALEPLGWDDERLGRPLGEVLLEPTAIYVRAVLAALESEVDVRGLAHITGGGLSNLGRLASPAGYSIDDPLPVPPVFGLIQEAASVGDEEMWDVFNMGCGFCVVVPEDDLELTVSILSARHPGSRRIGSAVSEPGIRRA